MKFIELQDIHKRDVIVNVSNIEYVWFGDTITGIRFKHGDELIVAETKEDFKAKLTYACMNDQ